jgi:hypothetical protein
MEPLIEAGVLPGERLGTSAVSLHDRFDQRAMLILLEQHELPERFNTTSR